MKTIRSSLLFIKHLHTDTDMSLDFVLGFTLFIAYFSSLFWCRKTQKIRGSLSFVLPGSSDHITLCRSSTVYLQCAFAHFKCLPACSCVSNGRLIAFHFQMAFSKSYWYIICSEISRLVWSCKSASSKITIAIFAICMIKISPHSYFAIICYLSAICAIPAIWWGII